MMIKNFVQGCCLWLVMTGAQMAVADSAVFVQDGRLLIYENSVTRDVELRAESLDVSVDEHRVSEYWGSLDAGQLVVTLEPNEARDVAAEEDHHCSHHSPGQPAWVVRRDGALSGLLCTNVLRAYPSPVGERVALISPDRDLSLWDGDGCTTVSAPGRVSNAGWSPDGRYLVMSVYPPDWSEGAVSEARTTADFLRLQNADLYMLDVESGRFVGQLTDDPGTEYGAFFSRDGRSLFYHWLHISENRGGLMRLDLDRDNGTSASLPAVQLTQVGETPLGRVTTYQWGRGGEQLVFEAGLPDGSGEIWAMTDEGTSATKLAAGRKPQALDDRSVVFMGADGKPQVVVPEVTR